MRREHQHPGAAVVGDEPLQCGETTLTGHGDVHDQRVGQVLGKQCDGLLTVFGFGQHRGAGAFEQESETHAHHGMVVGDDKAHSGKG